MAGRIAAVVERKESVGMHVHDGLSRGKGFGSGSLLEGLATNGEVEVVYGGVGHVDEKVNSK
jgi:hypothetical protein